MSGEENLLNYLYGISVQIKVSKRVREGKIENWTSLLARVAYVGSYSLCGIAGNL